VSNCIFRILSPTVAALWLVLAGSACAGEFSAAPIRIFMSPADRAVAVTVTNDGDEEILMHAEVYRWQQKPDGEDALLATDDLMLSPPVIKLGPRSLQVVRLVRLAPPPAGEEQTFRLFLREVPEAADPAKTQVRFSLTFSIPIFITPATARRRVDCSVERAGVDKLRAFCRNDGTAYAHVRTLALHADGGAALAQTEQGGYVLPEVRRGFELKSAKGPIPAGRYRLQATFDDNVQQAFDAVLPD
jgi:fimbrial chaperone protein